MDVAALPMGTTHSWTNSKVVTSLDGEEYQGLTCAPQAMVALHLSLFAVDSKLIWSH